MNMLKIEKNMQLKIRTTAIKMATINQNVSFVLKLEVQLIIIILIVSTTTKIKKEAMNLKIIIRIKKLNQMIEKNKDNEVCASKLICILPILSNSSFNVVKNINNCIIKFKFK